MADPQRMQWGLGSLYTPLDTTSIDTTSYGTPSLTYMVMKYIPLRTQDDGRWCCRGTGRWCRRRLRCFHGRSCRWRRRSL